MTTEVIDKLFLELSQVTKACTIRELRLVTALCDLMRVTRQVPQKSEDLRRGLADASRVLHEYHRSRETP